MRTHRFGQRIKLPSTRAIKHQIWQLTLQDYHRAQLLEAALNESVDVDGRRIHGPVRQAVHTP